MSETTSHRKVSESPALCRLDVVALQDPRTKWDGDPASPRYIPGAVRTWATALARRLGCAIGDPGRLLVDEWDALLAAPFVGRVCTEARGLARLVESAAA